VNLLDLALRYSSKEFLGTIVFYISELDIKQNWTEQHINLENISLESFTDIRFQLSLSIVEYVGGLDELPLAYVCVQVSSLIVRATRNITGSGKQTGTNPAGWVQSNLPWQYSSSSVQTAQQLVQR